MLLKGCSQFLPLRFMARSLFHNQPLQDMQKSLDPKPDTVGIPLWLGNKHVAIDVDVLPCRLVQFQVDSGTDRSDHDVQFRPRETASALVYNYNSKTCRA